MKWPEEERREDDYRSRYWETAALTVERYEAAPWRRAAVASSRKFVENRLKMAKKAGEPPRPPNSEELRDGWTSTTFRTLWMCS